MASVGLLEAQTVNRDDILYIVPYWFPFAGASDAAIANELADMRSRLGPEGPYVKLGFTSYVFISMDDWNVDASNPAAVRAALAGTISQIDNAIARARVNDVPLSLSFLTAIRNRYDPAQTASEAEDIRSMQWYADNVLAPGWWTYSRYARKQMVVREAYIRELGKIVANRMSLYPDTLVAASGDGEVELAFARGASYTIFADYSPFTVAEFRDWIRLGGLYAPGAPFAGQGYSQGAQYAGDLTPGTDTNGDGRTLNGDFGTNFQTWSLLHFDWSLSDAYLNDDPHRIPLATYSAPGFVRMPSSIAGGFDPPRVPEFGVTSPWWALWILFKQTMLQRHNIDFARWMSTSPDPATGATVPAERWYSYQIPADYLFNGSPEFPNERWYSSMSSWWTADVSPYGSMGITAFNIDFGTWTARTLINVAPRIAERNRRWGIIEWHPGLVPFDAGVSTSLDLFRSEMTIIEQYRPSLLQPFAWGSAYTEVKGTGFETALREVIARIKDGTPSDPRISIEAPRIGATVTRPFVFSGWAVDLGKIRGPGRGPGVDTVDVYAYPNPGSGADPIALGTASFGIARSDVAAAHGSQFANSGFSLTVQDLPVGRYDLVASVRSTVSLARTEARIGSVDVIDPPPPGAPAVTASPENQTVTAGGTATFSAGASGNPTPTGQWQLSTDSGSTWTNVPESPPYSAVTTTTLTITNAPISLNGARYRAVFTNSQGTATSDPATLTVTKATPVVTWVNPAAITYGTVLGTTQLNATANVPGTIAYTPAAGTVLNAGAAQVLSVTFTPTDTATYTTATKTVTIDVAKATPVVTWANPAAIIFGTPLSGTQLNGTANVPGTFAYTPAAGTVLNAGVGQTLSVTFTPTDAADYITATKTVTIVVLPVPTLAVAPATLRFAGTNTSGTLSPITAPQTVTVTFSGPPSSTWTATVNQPWVQITNGSGTGSGTFTVGIINPGNVLSASTNVTATVTVTASSVSNSPQTMAVDLALQQASANQAPFGVFDTPVDGTTGLQGSFAVTGWALDDVGIDRVEIWRNLVTGEDPTHAYTTDPSHPAYGKVFIARPLFITGSRTDVEALYANYPFANRAGWGYLLLSWGLWNQGNGTYTFFAYAFDAEGHNTLLGTKTIGVDNAHSVKPFGALDTPGYGATVSGTFVNFGWALTPNANTTDPRSCTITNGNVLMGIDSGPLLPVSYGDLRTDIAAAFPSFSNANNASGAFYIDTTTLTNGTHQIGWLVTDNCGRQDGVGSRFFTVLNGSSDALSEPAGAGRRVEGSKPRSAAASASVDDVAGWLPREAEGQQARATEGLSPVASASAPIAVRHLGGAWETVPPNAEGWPVIEVPQGGRIEVQLPLLAAGPYEGFQEVVGQRRSLPLGSSFDAKAGILYWQPAAGFLGSYDLVFASVARGAAATWVRVVVGPSMRTMIDTPQADAVVDQPFVVAGWTLDLAAVDGTGIDTLHIWAYPADGGEPMFLGVAAYGDARPDVAAVYGPAFERAGYSLSVAQLPPGTYDLVVYPHRAGTGTFDGAQSVRVIAR